MATLSILSWNIFLGRGYPISFTDQALRFASYFFGNRINNNPKVISDYLSKINCDIIGFQEINNYQLSEIAALTKMKNKYFSPEYKENRFLNYGNAIASHFNLEHVYTEILPYNIEKRNVLISQLKINKKEIVILITHFGAYPFNKNERINQSKKIIKIIDEINLPVILLADFNSEPGSKEFNILAEKMKPLINSYTYKSFKPTKIYDNILISSDFIPIESKVLEFKASDHFPVYAKLKLKN
ncbi:endonuclease/exonuclease/phosphatase family protein [Candidatus Woesearchaeota archaeon]|nr:endonuclease/exonuclease/phosphatase family protein [Candidatus Woesearchaeota archaeon]